MGIPISSEVKFELLDDDVKEQGIELYTEGRTAGELYSEIADDMCMHGITRSAAELIIEHCAAAEEQWREDHGYEV